MVIVVVLCSVMVMAGVITPCDIVVTVGVVALCGVVIMVGAVIALHGVAVMAVALCGVVVAVGVVAPHVVSWLQLLRCVVLWSWRVSSHHMALWLVVGLW